MTEDTPGDAPMIELRFVTRRQYGRRDRGIVDPALAAAWKTITGRTTIRNQDISALATLGIEVVEEVAEDAKRVDRLAPPNDQA